MLLNQRHLNPNGVKKMSYTTTVKVHAIRHNGSLEVINYTFTNEKVAYTFYLKATRLDYVDHAEFPGSHSMTFNNDAAALDNLDSFCG